MFASTITRFVCRLHLFHNHLDNFPYLFRSTPRVIVIEINPARHTASRQWLLDHLENEMVTELPHLSPSILRDDLCSPHHSTIMRISSNYYKVIAFVNKDGGCLCGDPARSPRHSLEIVRDTIGSMHAWD